MTFIELLTMPLPSISRCLTLWFVRRRIAYYRTARRSTERDIRDGYEALKFIDRRTTMLRSIETDLTRRRT